MTSTSLERCASLLTKIRHNEGRSIFIFFAYGFLLLFSYYLLKPLRESLILVEFSAETRSYAVATIALALLVIIPLYGRVARSTTRNQLVQWIAGFFAFNLVIFSLMGFAGVQFGFIYFVWVGIFGVMIVAQFWAFATDSYSVKSGQRLFPVIMIGTSVGALAGAQASKLLFPVLQAYGLMILAALILTGTLFLPRLARSAVPGESRTPRSAADGRTQGDPMTGFGVVFQDRYLRLIALFVVLLNWINSTGEFILAEVVVEHVDSLIAAGQTGIVKSEYLAAFYGDYIFWFTFTGLVFQVFLVSRIYCYIGVRGALLILPIIAVIGYGLLAFIPVFSIFRAVKILENSTDYSIMNTTRHALYLPTSSRAKYEGKTVIDTFFWRFGDLIQALFVFAGLNWWSFGIEHFALLNMVLGMCWIALAVVIGREYVALGKTSAARDVPLLQRPIPDVALTAERLLNHTFSVDTFVAADPADRLKITACLHSRKPLPKWLIFDPRRRLFTGKPPANLDTDLMVEVTATDLQGLSVSDTFTIHRHLRAVHGR